VVESGIWLRCLDKPTIKTMKAIVWVLAKIVLIAVIVVIAYGFYRTWKTARAENYALFLQGTVPTKMPEGLWKGSVPELGDVSWKGKKFLKSGSGINLIGDAEKFPFKFSKEKSIKEKDKEVIRLDYDQPGNPLWLRFIVDEMVSTGPNEFLGIVYIDLIPWIPFRMGYFRLTR